MGKSAVTLLESANKLASEKAKLSKKNILSDANKDKLVKAIDKRVSAAIAVLNRRPSRANKTIASGSAFVTKTYGLR